MLVQYGLIVVVLLRKAERLRETVRIHQQLAVRRLQRARQSVVLLVLDGLQFGQQNLLEVLRRQDGHLVDIGAAHAAVHRHREVGVLIDVLVVLLQMLGGLLVRVVLMRAGSTVAAVHLRAPVMIGSTFPVVLWLFFILMEV